MMTMCWLIIGLSYNIITISIVTSRHVCHVYPAIDNNTAIAPPLKPYYKDKAKSMDKIDPLHTRLKNRLFHRSSPLSPSSSSQQEKHRSRLQQSQSQSQSQQHYIYSSMPDHSVHGPWPPVPLWAPKFTVENYVRQLELPATFVYAGIYNNNFTSLPYPLFQMELLADGSFEWHAPFEPDTPLPWLDAEHDVGPTLLQIFKDGPKRWLGHRYVPCTSPNTYKYTNRLESP